MAQVAICIGAKGEVTDNRAARYLALFAFPVFLTTEVYFDSVSRVSPDMLVSCLVFAAASTLLRIAKRTQMRDAVLLGILLGAGYIVKAIFLPLALVSLAIQFVLVCRRSKGLQFVALTVAMFALFAVPYAAGMSWAFRHRTIGEVGRLNYAWRVNGLQGDIFWQGGPEAFGKPEHPAKQVMANPSVFLFDGPRAATFAPWFNPPYFYYGYRDFFSAKNQLRALASNSLTLLKLLLGRGVLYILLAGLILRRHRSRQGAGWFRSLYNIWPMLVLAGAGLSAYLAILLYPRYISSFVCIFLLSLCALFVGGDADAFAADLPRMKRTGLFVLMLLACILVPVARPLESYLDPIQHIRRNEFFWNDDEWKTAQYLLQTGAHPGENVAVIKNDFFCEWAYLAHLRIVGQVGGEWLNPRVDETGIFWHADPEKQRQILEIFHNSGAQLVVGFERPAGVTANGWEMVPGTGIWIYRQFK